ncbi:dihydrofolate reductase [Loigolactobacillus backii]|uniref:dihydrofolate reductase family protein n=1 Tax=Loigolactobacillus backii TaxID=375175 RepID=UPI000C1CB21A|nr:dihydrofolate reductase family protein [Loigolactobacillus backii]PIO83335.1 dihydrofolate reductase [Loigolactobacillus backii]
MRQVQFYGAISLDGYLATKENNMQWLFDTAGGESANTAEFMAQIDTTIMGRKTYAITKKLMNNAPLFPDKTNYVLSRTRQGKETDAIYTHESPVTLVKQLRQRAGANIWIIGGGQIVAELVAADLIDAWWIQIAPVLLGDGIPLFPKGDYGTRLDVVAVKQYEQLMELQLRRKTGRK